MGAGRWRKGGPHDVPHPWGPPRFLSVPARFSKGNADKTFPATRPGPGYPRWRPDKGKQKTPRSFPRAGFGSLSGFSLGRHGWSPRTSSHALRAWRWRSAPISSRPPQYRLGNLEMDRVSCPAARPGRAILTAVRGMLVTEISLLRCSVALTRHPGQGSRKCASKWEFDRKVHPIATRWAPSPVRSTSKITSRNFRITSMLVVVCAESAPVRNEPPRASARGMRS